MAIIIRDSLTITGAVKWDDDVQLAAGATITIAPGGQLDLNGHTLLVFGILNLQGDEGSFARIQGGTVSTEDTSGVLASSYGYWTNIKVDDFFSNGSLDARHSVFAASDIGVLEGTYFDTVLFRDSTINLNAGDAATIVRSTFVDSPVNIVAWTPVLLGAVNSFEQVNFVGAGNVVTLDPFFSGAGFTHHTAFSGSYIDGVAAADIDSKVHDADDDLRIRTDISPGGFSDSAYTNDPEGFRVGSELYTFSSAAKPVDPVDPVIPIDPVIPPDPELSFPGVTAAQLDFLTGVYVAAFNRAPEHDGLEYWAGDMVKALRDGMSEADAFRQITSSMYFSGAANGESGTELSNADYVSFLYQTALGREGEKSGMQYWTDELDTGASPRSIFITVFLTSALVPGNTDGAYVHARVDVAKHIAQEHISGASAPAGLLERVLGYFNDVHDSASAQAAIQNIDAQVGGFGAIVAMYGADANADAVAVIPDAVELELIGVAYSDTDFI